MESQGLWGRCKKCNELLTDSDYIYYTDCCEDCSIELAINSLNKVIEDINKSL